MNIDKDIKAAVKAGRLTHAEGWELNDMRRVARSVDKRVATLELKIEAVEAELDRTRLEALTAKIAEAPAAS